MTYEIFKAAPQVHKSGGVDRSRWQPWTRQITGLPFRYYGYAVLGRSVRRCCERIHRGNPTAQRCAERLVAKLRRAS